MNPKDIQAMAEIIRNMPDGDKGELKDFKTVLAKRMADYYEEEDKTLTKKIKANGHIRYSPLFNREHFLKDIGVQK